MGFYITNYRPQTPNYKPPFFGSIFLQVSINALTMSTQSSHQTSHTDIHDSERDKERMQTEQTTLDMQAAEDSSGKEHIYVPKMKEYTATTIS